MRQTRTRLDKLEAILQLGRQTTDERTTSALLGAAFSWLDDPQLDELGALLELHCAGQLNDAGAARFGEYVDWLQEIIALPDLEPKHERPTWPEMQRQMFAKMRASYEAYRAGGTDG